MYRLRIWFQLHFYRKEGSIFSNSYKMRRFFRRYVLPVFLIAVLYSVWGLWDISRIGNIDRQREADCAIVFGAAAWHDKPSPVLEERLNHAIGLYRDERIHALILTGGYGKGAAFSESEVAGQYCVQKGVPRHAIRIETNSQTTRENLIEAQKIIHSEGWDAALLVSDPWHMKRCRKMARDLKLKSYQSATQSTKYESFTARANFLFREFVMYHGYLFFRK